MTLAAPHPAPQPIHGALAPWRQGPAAAAEPSAPEFGRRPLLRPLRILHLEDSPSDSDLARELLDEEGIPSILRRVGTREEYVAALAAGTFDLIIADYHLPAFDGIAAFAIARQQCPDVPFIMLTGKLGEDYAVDTLKLGVTDYVLKQNLPRLAAAVRRALSDQQERATRREAQEKLRRYQEHLEELVRQRTAELEERNGQLAAANHDLESFVTTATHDLRTPLIVVGGFARRLADNLEGRADKADLELLRGVIAAGARMERLLDDLLDFFRASTAAPRKVPIAMEAAAREAFAELRPLVGDRQVDLRISKLPEALGDPAMIRLVLANLLGNAVKFTKSRPAAVITVAGWEDARETGYCVRDNGVGFDMRSRAKLFEILHRLHDKREYPGTGIGLAIVKRIVEKHGGRVWATGSVGEGARFCFALPRATPGPAA